MDWRSTFVGFGVAGESGTVDNGERISCELRGHFGLGISFGISFVLENSESGKGFGILYLVESYFDEERVG